MRFFVSQLNLFYWWEAAYHRDYFYIAIIALGEMYLPSYYYQRSTLEILVIILLLSIFRSQVSLFPSGWKVSLNILVYKVYLVNHLGLALLWVVAMTYEIQTAFTSSFVLSVPCLEPTEPCLQFSYFYILLILLFVSKIHFIISSYCFSPDYKTWNKTFG